MAASFSRETPASAGPSARRSLAAKPLSKSRRRLPRCRRRGGLLRLFFPLLHVLLEEDRHVFRRQRADAQPVLDAVRLQHDALVGVPDVRVVGAEFFQHAAVARLVMVDGHDAEIMTVLATVHFHANANSHGVVLPHSWDE